ncbi:hypothetical protein DPMN_123406 [Dreissena polymorpha]|uniref:Uncharacterized protein n=1 Tax=Dreissena polymorpha TaxID=45954 RepID=A0A9D4GQA3_DREPO|nr:hypothetical protein DPMN_123406 [Dreissena polymorpha]
MKPHPHAANNCITYMDQTCLRKAVEKALTQKLYYIIHVLNLKRAYDKQRNVNVKHDLLSRDTG